MKTLHDTSGPTRRTALAAGLLGVTLGLTACQEDEAPIARSDTPDGSTDNRRQRTAPRPPTVR